MKALIFDLDGTLVDTVYAHVFTWQKVFEEYGISMGAWRIHRRVGMSGDMFIRSVLGEVGKEVSEAKAKSMGKRHQELYRKLHPVRQPLPGAKELLKFLRKNKIKHGIATSGRKDEIKSSLDALDLPDDMVIVCKKEGMRAKPAPDLFVTCQKRLRVPIAACYAVGDATWDILSARRTGMLGIGLCTGGYSKEDLVEAGAFRIYTDAAALHRSLEELGFDVQ